MSAIALENELRMFFETDPTIAACREEFLRISDDLAAGYLTLTNHVTSIRETCSQALIDLADRIKTLLKKNAELLLFTVSTAFASLSFPQLFMAGIPVGALFSFLVGNSATHYNLSPDFYICRDFLTPGAVSQFTLGALNITGKAIVHLNCGRYAIGQEGIVSSLLAGALTGAYALSAVSFVIDQIKNRVL